MNWNSHFLDRTETPWEGRLPSDECLEVTEVHRGSIAEAANLYPGLLTRFLDGGLPVTDWNDLETRGTIRKIKTPFFDKQRKRCITLETVGFPWGIKLEQPHVQFCRELREGLSDFPEMAERILHANDAAYIDLVRAARYAIDHPPLLKRAIVFGIRSIGLFSKEIKKTNDEADHPLLAAAALSALCNNDVASAQHLLPEPSPTITYQHGKAVAAVYLYACALVAQASGLPRETVIEYLLEAIRQSPDSKRIRDALTTMQVAAPVKATNVLRTFPIDYVLPEADPFIELPGPNTENIRLGDALSHMQEDQIGIIVVLGGYRTNGFYNKQIENIGHHVLVIKTAPKIRPHTDFQIGIRKSELDENVHGRRALRQISQRTHNGFD